MKEDKEERKEEVERQIGSLASDMKADKEERKEETKANRKADQEMMEGNQARMEERLKEAMRVTVSAIEGKMEAAVNSVRSELDEKIEKTQAELRTVEASLDIRARKLEVTLENMKTDFITNLTMVNLGATPINTEALTQKCGVEETTATNKREFRAPLEAARAVAEGGRGIGGGASAMQLPKLDGTASWTVFRRQFETVAEHNGWTGLEKYTYLITALQGRVADELHGIPTSATYEETIQALEDRFGDQHIAAAYRSLLKSRKQRAGESLRDFTTAIERLAYRAYPMLPEEHIRREAGCAFVEG
jgi:hypothetical protein